MSFILDALKKSEIERRAGNAPGLGHASSYVIASSRRPGHAGPTLLAGAGMLVIGIVLGGWRSWQPLPAAWINPAIKIVREPAPVVPQPEAPVVRQPATPRPADLAKAPAPSKIAATVPVSQNPPPKAAVALEPHIVPRPPVQLKAQTVSAPRDRSSNTSSTDADSRPAPVAVASTRILDYRELPAEIRAGLPKVVFGGYAGVDEAEVRIAFINNLLVKEGEEVSPGLKLEQVGRDGVVLGYKGHHFRPGT